MREPVLEHLTQSWRCFLWAELSPETGEAGWKQKPTGAGGRAGASSPRLGYVRASIGWIHSINRCGCRCGPCGCGCGQRQENVGASPPNKWRSPPRVRPASERRAEQSCRDQRGREPGPVPGLPLPLHATLWPAVRLPLFAVRASASRAARQARRRRGHENE